jgi:hypothetical protein
MRLGDYLAARGESQEAFAARASKLGDRGESIDQRTVSRVVNGAVPSASKALAIIRASEAEPAEDGGTVSLEDLQPRRRRRRDRPKAGAAA